MLYKLASMSCAVFAQSAVLVKLSLLAGGVPLFNALVLGNVCEYHRKSYTAKTPRPWTTLLSQTVHLWL